MTLSATFIVAGFIKGEPYVIETDHNAKVHIREDFATVGEGSYIAQSIMMRREFAEFMTAREALYITYEAKKYAESVSSVGEFTLLTIMRADGKVDSVGRDARAWLDAQYAALSPKSLGHLKPAPPLYDGDQENTGPSLNALMGRRGVLSEGNPSAGDDDDNLGED